MVANRRPTLAPGDIVGMADGRQAKIEWTSQWQLRVVFRKTPGRGKFGKAVDMSRQAFWRAAA